MKKRIGKIGVFDSGFGGLHILRGIVKENPQYDYIYLGDTARSPYGTRTQETIYTFTIQAVDFLFKNGCDLVILACNTASAEALKKIQEDYLPAKYPHKKVLGVLIPAVEDAIAKSSNGRIGIIATQATVQSKAFSKEIIKRNASIQVYEQACPLLVPLVESGEHVHPEVRYIIERYLKKLKAKKIDTLILGCTHYGLIENKLRKILGKEVSIISEARIVPKSFKLYLENHPEIESTLKRTRKILFYSTDLTDSFCRLGSVFFGKKIKAKKVELV